MNDKIKDAMNDIANRLSHVYNQWYEDGLKDGKESVQIEVEAKIKEYEEKQKRTCDTCKYGGHTLQDLRKCVYCDGRYYWTPKKMTLDEAIKHCEEVADSKCDECGAEHRQLAEWLRELKQKKADERRREMTKNEIREGDIVVIDYIEEFTKEHRNEGRALVLWKGINNQPLIMRLEGEYSPTWSCYERISEVVGHIALGGILKALCK